MLDTTSRAIDSTWGGPPELQSTRFERAGAGCGLDELGAGAKLSRRHVHPNPAARRRVTRRRCRYTRPLRVRLAFRSFGKRTPPDPETRWPRGTPASRRLGK